MQAGAPLVRPLPYRPDGPDRCCWMRSFLWIALGAAGCLIVGMAVLWLWGSWAFSPKGASHLRRIAEGAFPDGVTFAITSEGPTFGPPKHSVMLGTQQSGRSFCAVFVEEGGPRPVAVRRLDSTRIEVEFAALLADRTRAVTVRLSEDRLPVEAILVDPKGALRRQALD